MKFQIGAKRNISAEPHETCGRRGTENAEGIFYSLHQLPPLCASQRGAILVDANIQHSIGSAIQSLVHFPLIPVPAHQKTRETKQLLEDELFKLGLGRDSLLIAVGGGNTTDLVGFLAATYMRGVPLILIPTTLLAMVDAAIGGKTGLDTPYGKNLIGAFYPPEAIFIEPRFLTSLPEKEMKNGQSEIVKYGLIWNRDILEMDLPNAIEASIQTKLEIVRRDPLEKGLRRILNFGHTIGHALEHVCGLSHGEAVALGCLAESRLSWMHGYLKEWKEVSKPFPEFDPVKLKQVLTLDKKAKGGIPRFVMLDRIGHCLEFGGEYCSPTHLLDELIDWMLHGRD